MSTRPEDVARTRGVTDEPEERGTEKVQDVYRVFQMSKLLISRIVECNWVKLSEAGKTKSKRVGQADKQIID